MKCPFSLETQDKLKKTGIVLSVSTLVVALATTGFYAFKKYSRSNASVTTDVDTEPTTPTIPASTIESSQIPSVEL